MIVGEFSETKCIDNNIVFKIYIENWNMNREISLYDSFEYITIKMLNSLYC